jgi:nicotinamidase-related amidase
MAGDDIHFGPLGDGVVHICVDMQRMFEEETEWHLPWMTRVLPAIVALVEPRPERTVFTRFIPAREPGIGHGTWRRYYERYAAMTLDRLGEEMVELSPALRPFVPPGTVHDKWIYSPWINSDLDRTLKANGTDTLIVSGGETDVCVLTTVLGAIDLGYRVIVATDAICSSADPPHDAAVDLYHSRYGMQVETAEVETILRAWH